jgi:hypothetical protein
MDAAKYPQLSAIDSPKQLRRLPERKIVPRCRPRARAAYPSLAAGGWN